MAKFQLNPGETLIGSGMMSIYLKQGLSKKPFQGNIYITNQRACFKISMMPSTFAYGRYSEAVPLIPSFDGRQPGGRQDSIPIRFRGLIPLCGKRTQALMEM